MKYKLENVRKAVFGPIFGAGIYGITLALTEIAELEGNVFAPIAGLVATALTVFYAPNKPATSDDPGFDSRGPIEPGEQ